MQFLEFLTQLQPVSIRTPISDCHSDSTGDILDRRCELPPTPGLFIKVGGVWWSPFSETTRTMRFFWVCFVSPDISSGNQLQGNQSGVLGQFQYPPLEKSAKYSITWVRSVGSGIATRVDVYTKSSVYPYFHLESRLQRSHHLYHGKCDSFNVSKWGLVLWPETDTMELPQCFQNEEFRTWLDV